ncbi:MAG: DUF1330 domain-containing protein [Betaproteobacteria bacterium]|nr:DUF1330 domain-containing protein [Betaproteobacteria bacterium]
MTAYCVGRIRVKDESAWEWYRQRVGATIAQYGGEVMFRGGLRQAFSGTEDHDTVVALRFENLDAAKRWHDSPEYQALIPMREQGAEVTLTLYQG